MRLSAELLESFPDCPSSLEYLKWDTAEKAVLYRLEREGEKVRAVECEPLRVAIGNGFWTDRKVLDLEN